MARKKELCQASSGLYVRNIGWVRTQSGYRQHKFYLGRDQFKATLVNLRLEQLWAQVSKRWNRENSTELDPADRPIWDPVTLAIAEAVRRGDEVARIPLPSPFSALIPESPMITDWLNRLQNDITLIRVELQDNKARQHAEEFSQQHGRRLIEMGQRMIRKESGQSVHAALDAYSHFIAAKYLDVEKKVTQWGRTQTRQVAFIRRHLPPVDLVELDTQRIEDFLDLLRLRPCAKNGKPVSVAWTRNCIKQFRHFLRWLNRSSEFDWKKPADLEFGRINIPLLDQEKSARARRNQVSTYSTHELRTLWEYATPFQRLIILLGLNCGFGRAELASLEMADVLLHQKHPHEHDVGFPSTSNDSWIIRVRHKSGVYGEWKLWPETVNALDWWLRQRSEIAAGQGIQNLLITNTGHRIDLPTKGNNQNSLITNRWWELLRRVRKDQPSFRCLSFGKLRKTSGNLIRSVAGGEIAAVFLCHGIPLGSDELLDVYTNRPFAKVFSALENIGERLRPIWTAVPEAFPEKPKKGGANISLAKIRRIQSMKKQGFKDVYIANELGISVETVRRRTLPDANSDAASRS